MPGSGSELTEYHVEAAVASVHADAQCAEDTDWGQIVFLYDALMTIRPSPVVALNRAIAVAQHAGPERGLEEIREIADAHRLAEYPFYSAALGELDLRSGGTRSRASTSKQPSPWGVTPWSADFWSDAWRRVKVAHQSGPWI